MTPKETSAILRHWREAVPNDRLAHLVRDAARGLTRARVGEQGQKVEWLFEWTCCKSKVHDGDANGLSTCARRCPPPCARVV